MTVTLAPAPRGVPGVETTLGPPPPGHDAPVGGMAVHGDRLFATQYFTRTGAANEMPAPGKLHVLDRVTLEPSASPITVGWQPLQVVVDGSARRVYVRNRGPQTPGITVIDLDSLTPVGSIDVGFGFVGLVVDAARDVIYVLNQHTRQIVAYDGSTLQEVRRFDVGDGLTGDATIDESNRFLYASRFTNGADQEIEVLDLAPPDPTTPRPAPIQLPVNCRPRDVTLDDAARRLYVRVEGVAGIAEIGVLAIDLDALGQPRHLLRQPGGVAIALDQYRGLLHILTSDRLSSFAATTLAPASLSPDVLGATPTPRCLTVDRETSTVLIGDQSGRIRTIHPDTAFGDAPQAPAGAPLTMITHDDQLELFVIGTDDRLRTAHWSPDDDWDTTPGWADLPEPIPVRTPTVAISRSTNEWELFTVRGNDLCALRGTAGGATEPWETIDSGFPAGCHVAAITRFPGERTAFCVGLDGQLHLYGGAGSTEHVVLGAGPALTPGTPIAATSRKADHWDLFVLADDAQVWTNWWSADDGFGGWSRLGGSFAPGTPITAISRGRTDIELFGVRDDGQIVMQYWHSENGWSGWFPVAAQDNDAPLTATVAVVGRPNDQRDLFVARADRQIWAMRGDGWKPVGGRVTQPGAPVAAAARGDWVHLCWASEGGSIETAWWHPLQPNGGWSLDSGVRMRVPTDSILFRAPVETGAALSGQVVTRLWRDGTVQVQGHMHGSGWDPYRFTVHTAVHADSGDGLLNQHRGRVDGTGSEPLPTDPAPDRDHDWIELGVNPVVHGGFDDFAATGGTAAACDEKNIGLGGGIQGFIDGVIDEFLQPYVLSPVRRFNRIAGFVGHEVAEYIGFVPTAQSPLLVNGVLSWIPGYKFLFPVIKWTAEIGGPFDPDIAHRTIEKHELDWANRVFGGALPPAESIVLTDAVGLKDPFTPGDGRCFVVPAGDDGPILVNLGKAFENPLEFTKDNYPEPGQLFIHELTHVWHVHNTPMSRLEWTWGAMRDSDYSLPAEDTSWSDVKFEAKASVVDEWYANHHRTGFDTRAAINDPLFEYITHVRNRRTGD